MCEPTEVKPSVQNVEKPNPNPVEYEKCYGCGCPMHPDSYDEYRSGYWCSRSCAYDESY